MELGNGVEIKVPLYDDEFYTQCGECGAELKYDSKDIAEIINHGGDLIGTSVICGKCRG
jgi:hypothetical protein